jgi:hypothetical protein
MRRINRVVWRGDFIYTDRIPIGPLVYRDDRPFLRQRDRIVRMQWMATVVALSAVIFFLVGTGSLATVALALLWMFILLMDVIQLNMWRGMDRGIVVHENGLDTLDYRHFTIGRVFVPREEISHFATGILRFTIYLKHSRRKLFCHKRMVDEATVWHIWRLLEGGRPGPRAPELVVYGDEGVSTSSPPFRV